MCSDVSWTPALLLLQLLLLLPVPVPLLPRSVELCKLWRVPRGMHCKNQVWPWHFPLRTSKPRYLQLYQHAGLPDWRARSGQWWLWLSSMRGWSYQNMWGMWSLSQEAGWDAIGFQVARGRVCISLCLFSWLFVSDLKRELWWSHLNSLELFAGPVNLHLTCQVWWHRCVCLGFLLWTWCTPRSGFFSQIFLQQFFASCLPFSTFFYSHTSMRRAKDIQPFLAPPWGMRAIKKDPSNYTGIDPR